jgi:hypothetical protein
MDYYSNPKELSILVRKNTKRARKTPDRSKPLSLHPLNLEEAVKKMLSVKPPARSKSAKDASS